MTYFTICVPAYNRAHTILRTLESIKTQSFSSYEVVIVDDGSKDDTTATVQKYIEENGLQEQFFYYYKENGGKHTALNFGIEKAQGEFFVILDSDDWLVENALESLHSYCEQIKSDDSYCGVMGKSINSATGEIIGDLFDLTDPKSSYFDYHFIIPQTRNVVDCFEANKTKILKQYRFPEPAGVKFVPEAWMFDQIGVQYHLLLTNDAFRLVEYMADGITSDSGLKQRNAVGFLYHYVSRLENVLPKKKLSFSLRLKLYTVAWWRYWQCVKLDKSKQGPRVKRVTFFGFLMKLGTPLLTFVAKRKYKDNNRI